jgi:hypothetical protein
MEEAGEKMASLLSEGEQLRQWGRERVSARRPEEGSSGRDSGNELQFSAK